MKVFRKLKNIFFVFFVIFSSYTSIYASKPELVLKGLSLFDRPAVQRYLYLSFPENEILKPIVIEDSLFLLGKHLEEEGYLNATIDVLLEGKESILELNQISINDIPFIDEIPEDVIRIVYTIEKHNRFYYRELNFVDLENMSGEDAADYFFRDPFLFASESRRIFSNDRFEKSIRDLKQAIINRGYADAEINILNKSIDPSTGEVKVTLEFVEGNYYFFDLPQISGNKMEALPDLMKVLGNIAEEWEGHPFSESSISDLKVRVRKEFFRRGYPFVKLKIEPIRYRDATHSKAVTVDIGFESGPEVEIDKITFEGNKKTERSILMRLSGLEDQKVFDLLALEAGRDRLGRTEIITKAQFDFEPLQPFESGKVTRDVVFQLEERKRLGVDLILGYGSYEGLRAGIELSRLNLLGKAHNIRTRFLKSQKSVDINFRYQVPHIFGERWTAEARASYLEREELSFNREEYGIDFGIQVPDIYFQGNLYLRYSLEELNAAEIQGAPSLSATDSVRSSSLQFQYIRDIRDNPVYPTDGSAFRFDTEIASTLLGSETAYLRVQLDFSWHQVFFKNWIFHFGYRQGIVSTWENDDSEIPFNKRYFPGGHHSIRGFKEGAASPRNSAGDILGAEVFHLLNLEIERPLFPHIFGVLFFDGLLEAENFEDYPGKDSIGSIGAGLRWRTPLGPVRVEYAHILNPRPFDEKGRWHISIGFPF